MIFLCSETTSRTVTLSEIVDLVQNIIDSSLSLCILSYFVRAESTQYPSQFEEQREERIQKELGAALAYSPTSYDQVKDCS